MQSAEVQEVAPKQDDPLTAQSEPPKLADDTIPDTTPDLLSTSASDNTEFVFGEPVTFTEEELGLIGQAAKKYF